MMRLLRKIGYLTAAFAVAFALAPVENASASAVYTYEGAELSANAQAPFAATDKVIGTITFAAPLAANLKLAAEVPVSFSFTAGVEVMTSAIYNPNFGHIYISTDSQGNITAWDIQVAAGGLGQINIENYVSVIGANIGDQAVVGAYNFPPGTGHALNHTAGTFTTVAAVPEPSTWAMMILGFCGICVVTYRRKASAFSAA